MRISFYQAAVFVAVLCAALFALLLFDARIYIDLYGVTGGEGALFTGRRAAPLFAGFAVLFWCARNAEPSPLRHGICWTAIVTFALIAMTGIFAFATGIASFSILVAAICELLIAGVFLQCVRQA